MSNQCSIVPVQLHCSPLAKIFMGLLKRFGAGLEIARRSRGLTEADFSLISSRTYLGGLERGIKSPTICKVEELASVIGIHPLSLLAIAYLPTKPEERDEVWARIKADLESFNSGQ